MSEPTKIQIKQNFWWMPLLIALLITIELVWSQQIWMMLSVALGGTWLFDFVWARLLARGIRLKRELRYGWAQVGDQLEERFTLSNSSPVPVLWIQITDHSNLGVQDANRVTGVERAGENAWQIKHTCTRRGAFRLGPTQLSMGTPFGMYSVEFEYAASDNVLVMPPTVPLPEIPIAPGGRADQGRRRASTFEQTINSVGIREYVDGDPFHLIHWHTSAHLDRLMVRTLESTPSGDWWIWLDLDERAQVGNGENSTLEHSIVLGASLAERGLSAGRRVGLIANGAQLVWIEPQAGEFQRLAILRALATVESGSQSLAEQVKALAPSTDRSGCVIFITAAQQTEWTTEVMSLALRDITPTVILLDPASYGGNASARQMTEWLAQCNIPFFVVTQDLMNRPEAQPGQQGRWEWRVSATGRAIARSAPQDQDWRVLT